MTYNGSLTREQFMFQEMRIVAKLLSEGMSDDDVLKRVTEENMFQYPTEREIKSKCGACLKRLKCVEDMPVISQAIGFGTLGEAKQAVLISMMCQNQLVADFMICVIGDKYRNLDMTITRKDMNVFFQNLAQSNETVAVGQIIRSRKLRQFYVVVSPKRNTSLMRAVKSCNRS